MCYQLRDLVSNFLFSILLNCYPKWWWLHNKICQCLISYMFVLFSHCLDYLYSFAGIMLLLSVWLKFVSNLHIFIRCSMCQSVTFSHLEHTILYSFAFYHLISWSLLPIPQYLHLFVNHFLSLITIIIQISFLEQLPSINLLYFLQLSHTLINSLVKHRSQ